MAQVRQRVADTLQTVTAPWQDTSFGDDLARLIWEDLHQAALDRRDAVLGLTREVLSQAFAVLDDHGDWLQIEEKSDR